MQSQFCILTASVSAANVAVCIECKFSSKFSSNSVAARACLNSQPLLIAYNILTSASLRERPSLLLQLPILQQLRMCVTKQIAPATPYRYTLTCQWAGHHLQLSLYAGQLRVTTHSRSCPSCQGSSTPLYTVTILRLVGVLATTIRSQGSCKQQELALKALTQPASLLRNPL